MGGDGSVPLMSFWTFSDIFEEQGQAAAEFSQAFGMQVRRVVVSVAWPLGQTSVTHSVTQSRIPTVPHLHTSIELIPLPPPTHP